MKISYITDKHEEVWEEKISSDLGIISLKKMEIKRDKICMNLLDTQDGTTTGETYEILKIIDTRGELLIDKKWHSNPYFLHRRQFSITTIDSYYSHYLNIPPGAESTLIMKFDYEAQPYAAPNLSDGFIITLEIFLGTIIYYLIKRKK